MSDPSTSPSPKTSLTLVAFFLSGFAALLYQVVWQRWLVFFTGISSASICLIVAVFMAGLGIGYLAGGALADRMRAPRPLLFFVFAEIGIAAFGVCSKLVLYDGLYASGMVRSTDPVRTCLVLLAVLLVPTFLMGLSLPLLSKSVRLDSVERQAGFVGRLYFVNTLGAAIGAVTTGLLLVPVLGFLHATYAGAALNLICAALGMILYRDAMKSDATATSHTTETSPATKPFRWTWNFGLWLAQFAVAGFAAIALELAWFRVLDNTIKSLSQTFSILLAVYLLFLALGTRFGERFTGLKREAKTRLFLLSQYLLYLWMAGSVIALFYALETQEWMAFLSEYFRALMPTWDPKIVLVTYGLIPLFLMALPTFLMGMSFTLSQHLVQDSQDELGRKVGWLQFANILGCVAATWFATFVGFDKLGTAGLLRWVAMLGLIYAVLLAWRLRTRWIALPLLAGLMLLAINQIPRNDRFWTILGGMHEADERIFNENATGISMIKLGHPGKPSGTSFCNGISQSRVPYSRDIIHVRLGVIPVLLHPSPRHVAVIGLGSGGTVFGIGCRPATESIVCFEVMTNEPSVLREYANRMHYIAPVNMLDDPRLELRFQDGREALQNESAIYDVIEADPPYPNRAFAGNLYSIEYFHLLKDRLKPDGFAVSWKPPGSRVAETFCAVFPWVYEAGGYILIGSKQPLVLDPAEIQTRLIEPYINDHLGSAGMALAEVTDGGKMLNITTLQQGTPTPPKDFNTDMIPKDEFVNPLPIFLRVLKTGKLPEVSQ